MPGAPIEVSLDPAESFEFSGNDVLNNVYDTLIELDPADLGPLVPGLAESWRSPTTA